MDNLQDTQGEKSPAKEAKVTFDPRHFETLDDAQKIEYLSFLLERRGLDFVNKILQHLDPKDAFVLDRFHDILRADERYKKFFKE